MNPLPDFDIEIAATRRTLERIPEDKLGWKPDEKSGTVGWMAGHIATLPMWGTMTLGSPELCLDGMQPPPPPESKQAILDNFEKTVEEFRAALAKATDDDLAQVWKCTWNGKVLIEAPRAQVLRHSVMNHLIHHRAQLTMYFRLLGVPVPGLYGPSADEVMHETGASA
jgi:uncharacterized damage-inducible protein DinB